MIKMRVGPGFCEKLLWMVQLARFNYPHAKTDKTSPALLQLDIPPEKHCQNKGGNSLQTRTFWEVGGVAMWASSAAKEEHSLPLGMGRPVMVHGLFQ